MKSPLSTVIRKGGNKVTCNRGQSKLQYTLNFFKKMFIQ
ncbi:Hypothetical protein (plasmid) [Klebsiella pneumoniae]|uniref:Uncharacterized protein n=3 Tax=Enterobacteriaceae TaxID=543 RepID=A0A7L8KAU8_ECOLX|nr:hypothetical protein [Citrobacter freundii]ALU64646.1 hypothetical protein [Klebsiella pneumoniae]ANI75670.1 Hypothetical protein [Klebsiella pneumoniae]QGW60118.1 hypothetical protein [Citrobacter freundii]QOE89541.1 hypothetical protein [Escherichia coli]